MDFTNMHIIKANGKRELFSREKLVGSLIGAGTSADVSEAIVSEIEGQLYDGIMSSQIYERAFAMLHAREKRIAARYSLRRAIAELGPTGFPFEKFISEIFIARGYTVLTDQILKGACAEHEVDVVAYNDEECIAVEVKFHNEVGIKSDLKVALYVKARLDDLMEEPVLVAGEKRKITDGWLVTNTKFTQTAINYAFCKNLKLIGWNYPPKGNLEDLVSSYNLYPITCLSSLTSFDKKALIEKGVTLVKMIKNDTKNLKDIGMTEERINHVLNEITILFAE